MAVLHGLGHAAVLKGLQVLPGALLNAPHIAAAARYAAQHDGAQQEQQNFPPHRYAPFSFLVDRLSIPAPPRCGGSIIHMSRTGKC